MAAFTTPRRGGTPPGFDSALPGGDADARVPVVGWAGGKLVQGVRRGLPAPGVEPAQPLAPKILFGGKVDPRSITAHTLDRIRANAAAQGITELQISSAQRDARAQASAMYDNLVRLGERSQRRLYKPHAQPVLDIAMAEIAAGSSRDATIGSMAGAIDEIRRTDPTAFKHVGDPTRLQAIDIAPRSLRGADSWEVLRDRLLSGLRRDQSISTVLGHGQGDPAIHIEIPQN